MKRVLTAVVLIPLVLGVVLWDSFPVFVIATGLVAALCLLEYLKLVEPIANWTPKYLATALLVAYFVWIAVSHRSSNNCKVEFDFLGLQLTSWDTLIVVIVTLGVRGVFAKEPRGAFLGTSMALAGFVGIFVPFASLITIYSLFPGRFFVLLLFVTVWAGDIAAYYVGRSIGRHKLAPVISPGKSWEGAIASIVVSSLAAVAFTRFCGPVIAPRCWPFQMPPLWLPVLMAVPINITAQLGDLSESLLKRAVGAKDSGTLLPGHGGMLDRIDALLLAAPIALLIFLFSGQYFFMFGGH